MKQVREFFFGIVLLIIGVVAFLKNVTVSNFTLFYRYDGYNVGGILVLLAMVAFIACIVKPNILTKLILTLIIITFFVCMILSLDFHVRYMSGLLFVLILGSICVGIALILKALIFVSKEDKNEK